MFRLLCCVHITNVYHISSHIFLSASLDAIVVCCVRARSFMSECAKWVELIFPPNFLHFFHIIFFFVHYSSLFRFFACIQTYIVHQWKHRNSNHIFFSVECIQFSGFKIELAFASSKLMSIHISSYTEFDACFRSFIASIVMKTRGRCNDAKKKKGIKTTTTLNQCPGEITETHRNFTFFSIVCAVSPQSHGLTLASVRQANAISCTANAGFFLWPRHNRTIDTGFLCNRVKIPSADLIEKINTQ